MKKAVIIFSFVFIVLTAAFFTGKTYAAGDGEYPSLIVNDEKWYKDAGYPLIERNGDKYVPAELFTMFDYITLTYPDDGNLLLENTLTQDYISVLFNSNAAAVNGEVVENIGVFRNSGVFYIKAESTADALGISYENYVIDDVSGIRFFDENRIFTLSELLKSYTVSDDGNTSSDTQNEADGEENSIKRIFVFCSTEENSDAFFAARDSLENYGIEYTYLVSENTSSDFILKLMAEGGYCLAMPNYSEEESKAETADTIAAYFDSLNSKLKVLTGKNIRYTMTTGDDELDSLLLERGYCAIKPDFDVNGASYPDGIIEEIKMIFTERDYVTLYLGDCWNSERISLLLSEMQNENTDVEIVNFCK